MRKIFLLLSLLTPCIYVNAQTPDTTVHLLAQQMPKFNGDLYQYLSEHIMYPPQAMSKNAQGTVYVEFIIEKDGSVNRVHIKKSVEHSLDSAAMACIHSMPKWIPGSQNGQPVRVQYEIPINFQMPDITPKSVNPSTPPRVK